MFLCWLNHKNPSSYVLYMGRVEMLTASKLFYSLQLIRNYWNCLLVTLNAQNVARNSPEWLLLEMKQPSKMSVALMVLAAALIAIRVNLKMLIGGCDVFVTLSVDHIYSKTITQSVALFDFEHIWPPDHVFLFIPNSVLLELCGETKTLSPWMTCVDFSWAAFNLLCFKTLSCPGCKCWQWVFQR